MAGIASGELVEREHALAALSTPGSCLVLEGASGLGKTAVLERAVAAARARGDEVTVARGDVLERGFAYGVVRQLLEPLLLARGPDDRDAVLSGAAAPVAALVLDGVDPPDPVPVAHAVHRALRALAAERPLLLAIDNGQWADALSARVLLHVARRLDDATVSFVLAQQPGGPPELAEHLPLVADLVTLAPLSPTGTAALVRRGCSRAGDRFVAEVHDATGGDPAAVAAIAEVGTVGALTHHDAWVRTVRRRTLTLSPAARATAEAAAVLGAHATPPLVAALAGVSVDEVLAQTDRLAAAGLTSTTGGLAPSSAVAVGLRAGLADGVRARLHRHAARLLSEDAADPEAVAEHLHAAPPAGDAATVALLRGAAQAAARRGAPGDAVRHLLRALAEPPPRAVRPEVLVDLSTAEFDAGLPSSATRLRAALDGLEDPAARIDVLGRLAALEVLHQDGQADAGVFEAELERAGDDAELRLAAELAAIEVLLMVPERQAERQQRIARLPAPQAVPHVQDRIAFAHRAWLEAERGERPAAVTHGLAWRALSGGALLDLSLHRPSFHLACRALIVADALPQAADALSRMEDRVVRQSSRTMQAAVAHYRADLHHRAGRVEDAEHEARRALELHDQRDIVLGGAVEALVNALVERSRLDEAEAVLRAYGWDGPLTEHYGEVGLRLARARLALARGDAGPALDDALACGRLRERQRRPNPAWTPWRSTAALAHVLAGDVDAARRLADDELRRTRRYGAPRALGMALRARAAAATDATEAVALLQEAAEVLGMSVAALEHARALTDLGEALRRRGDLVEAREPLRVALATADGLGASTVVRRAREELVATGLRPRRAQTSGVASLTPRQRRVCELAAAGRTNSAIARELFVSVKTVETHLSAAYRKLGVAAKHDLAAALAAGAG